MRGDGTVTEKAGIVELNLEAHILQGNRYKCEASPFLKEELALEHQNITNKKGLTSIQ